MVPVTDKDFAAFDVNACVVPERHKFAVDYLIEHFGLGNSQERLQHHPTVDPPGDFLRMPVDGYGYQLFAVVSGNWGCFWSLLLLHVGLFGLHRIYSPLFSAAFLPGRKTLSCYRIILPRNRQGG